jgi:hypothetical protein
MAALSADLQAKLEAYLLGRLPHGEQTRIETLVFDDDEVLAAVRDAEDDLIDRYLAGALAAADREAFEKRFATSISRKERIAFARALADGLASGSTVAARRRSRFVLPAVASLAAALVIGVALRALVAPDGARVVTPPSPAVGTGTTPPSAPVAPPSDPPAVATLILPRVDLQRGGGTFLRLRVPEGATAVRFQAEVARPIAGARYAATLRRVEGDLVWQGDALVNVAQRHLSVTLPAELVQPGDYILRLAAPGASSDEYPFRISAN